jgi:hypothetical protein
MDAGSFLFVGRQNVISLLSLCRKDNRIDIDKFKRLNHILGSALVFFEMPALQMCFECSRIGIYFENGDAGGIAFFGYGI